MTSLAEPSILAERRSLATVLVEVVIPVYNEEAALPGAVRTVLQHLSDLPFRSRVTIADNASIDATGALGRDLAARHPSVSYLRLDAKGRGRALKRAWSDSDADILVYMDVDLSTDLSALLPLVAPLATGHSDLAIGTRLARSSNTTRGLQREVISRMYNRLLRGTLRARFSDAQCGFKAVRREVAQQLLPLIEDNEWFFDTELLVVAERAGLRIHEVPVDWVDDPDSSVDIVRTALDDLRGIARMSRALMRREIPLEEVRAAVGRTRARSVRGGISAQILVFAAIGVASTVAYGLLFLLLRGPLDAFTANAAALALTAIGNTASNRRLTFGVRGPERRLRHHLQGLSVFAIGLGVTTGSLAALRALGGDGHPVVEVVVLTVANLGVTVMRFLAMRLWIFARADDRGGALS